jgi:hypothetical protein
MKRNLCLLLLITLILSNSCRRKSAKQGQDLIIEPPIKVESEKATPEKQTEKPVEEKPKEEIQNNTFDVWFVLSDEKEAIVKECGVSVTNDMGLMVAKVTQKQFDILKQKNIKVYKKWEWIKIENKDSNNEIDKQSRSIPDAYKDLLDQESKSKFTFTKSRIYRDLNQDGIPEIFFDLFGGTGGENYLIYQITKDGYKEMGSYFYLEMQVLQTKHNGFCDIMTYLHINASVAHFRIYEFDGYKYVATKEMFGFYGESIDEKIFLPDFQNVKEEDFDPKWSPKDDDKYRRMIK